jgi:hypothetical protein
MWPSRAFTPVSNRNLRHVSWKVLRGVSPRKDRTRVVGHMDVVVNINGASADQLRDLRLWLNGEAEFRGRVRLGERPPEGHELGPVTDSLQVVLGSGGAVAALAGVVIAWLRTRPGEIVIKLVRGEDQIEVSAKGVKSLGQEDIRVLSEQITKMLEGPDGRA